MTAQALKIFSPFKDVMIAYHPISTMHSIQLDVRWPLALHQYYYYLPSSNFKYFFFMSKNYLGLVRFNCLHQGGGNHQENLEM